MKEARLALLVTCLFAATARAQDGGKLEWRGKGKDDPKAAMADAKRHGRAMMLFFTSEG
jgi:hypothetical protein